MTRVFIWRVRWRNPFPADTDVFKTSSGRLEKVTTYYDQTRRLSYVVLKTSNLGRLEEVWFTTSWRRLIYVVLSTSNLRRHEDVRFTSSWRRPIYDVLKRSDLRRLVDVWITTSWKRPIYDSLKTPVKWRLCSNVVVASVQRQKKWFFLILYCLKY